MNILQTLKYWFRLKWQKTYTEDGELIADIKMHLAFQLLDSISNIDSPLITRDFYSTN